MKGIISPVQNAMPSPTFLWRFKVCLSYKICISSVVEITLFRGICFFYLKRDWEGPLSWSIVLMVHRFERKLTKCNTDT